MSNANKPAQATPSPAPTDIEALQLRVTALEEFLAHMATVIECERHGFSADRMNAWLDTATTRMQVTGSASAEEVKALRRLQRIVVG
jgi:hypothetical protein